MRRGIPLVLAAVLLLAACDQRQGPPPAKVGAATPQRDSSLIVTNRNSMRREVRSVEQWMALNKVQLASTGTGVRYHIIHDEPGATMKPGQYALVRYALLLLNGDTAYVSDPGSAEAFLVEEDNVESGLHEAIQLLSVGDSALILLPSHRAHGLLGDRDRIPPQSTVVYYLGVKGVR